MEAFLRQTQKGSQWPWHIHTGTKLPRSTSRRRGHLCRCAPGLQLDDSPDQQNVSVCLELQHAHIMEDCQDEMMTAAYRVGYELGMHYCNPKLLSGSRRRELFDNEARDQNVQIMRMTVFRRYSRDIIPLIPKAEGPYASEHHCNALVVSKLILCTPY